MAGNVQHTNLTSPSARSRLKRGRQPHWHALVRGRVHLGYQRWPEDHAGRWLLRQYAARKYRTTTLGTADDQAGTGLSFDQAEAMARAMVGGAPANAVRLTVRQAMAQYIECKQALGQATNNIVSRSTVYILPMLGDCLVAELTAAQLRNWLATCAALPVQWRGKRITKRAPATDESVRARRNSANRVLGILKAALNHAYDEGHIASRVAWDRKLKPFRNVAAARIHYLDIAQSTRLINAAGLDFRPLVCAALETGCRYGELVRLEVADFNSEAGTLTIRRAKSGKPRHVILTPEGADFFRGHCAGRARGALMFARADGCAWGRSEQHRRMRAACAQAGIVPAVGFHALRHTWASLATMAGVPLLVVARNLGHADTRMVERHYGHLAPSYITAAIHAGAPRYGLGGGCNKRVIPLR
jgi:integrase